METSNYTVKLWLAKSLKAHRQMEVEVQRNSFLNSVIHVSG